MSSLHLHVRVHLLTPIAKENTMYKTFVGSLKAQVYLKKGFQKHTEKDIKDMKSRS